jgi:NTE family protein
MPNPVEDCRFTLALGGGGALGLAHVGVLRAFSERGLTPVAISGSSMGAIIGGAYALGMDLDPLLDARTVHFFFAVFTRGGYLVRRLRKLFGDARMGDCRIPFIVCVAPANDVRYPLYMEDPELPMWQVIAASSALPPVFGGVRINGQKYLDGGVSDNLPAAPLRRFNLPIVSVELGFLKGALRGDEVQTLRRFVPFARYQDLGDLMLEPDLSRYSPNSFSDGEAIAEAGYRAAVTFLEGR